MNIELDDNEGKLLIKALVGGGIATLAETRTLVGIADRIEAKLSRPFKKGDIVHAPQSTSECCDRIEVLATACDGQNREWVWCREGDGYLCAYLPDRLAHGERP